MTRRGLRAVLIAAGLLLSACGGGDGATTSPSATSAGSPTPTVSGVPAGDARIEITSPEDGATIASGEKVEVTVEVSGFELVSKIDKKAVEGEGHIMYYLGSGYEIPVNPDSPANIGGSGSYTTYSSHERSYTWPTVPSGRQTLTVQLVNNDRTPLVPAQSDQVTITVS